MYCIYYAVNEFILEFLAFEDFNIVGLDDFTEENFNKVMAFNRTEWKAELVSQGEFFIDLYDHMPKELIFQRELLAARMS